MAADVDLCAAENGAFRPVRRARSLLRRRERAVDTCRVRGASISRGRARPDSLSVFDQYMESLFGRAVQPGLARRVEHGWAQRLSAQTGRSAGRVLLLSIPPRGAANVQTRLAI